MNVESFYTKHMLMQYGKQLVTARRLARYEQMLGARQDVSPQAAAMHRRIMVERVAREITDNLVFSGSDNFIVQQVMAELEQAVGEKLVFQYPPGDLDFKIFRVTTEGEEELDLSEKQTVMEKVWEIALRTVDATML